MHSHQSRAQSKNSPAGSKERRPCKALGPIGVWRDLLYSQGPLEGLRPFSRQYLLALLLNHDVARGVGRSVCVHTRVHTSAYFLPYHNSNWLPDLFK